jgi:hypothetical protein
MATIQSMIRRIVARVTEQKVYLSGYRPSWEASRDGLASIEVKGNTFAIKNELATSGLRWNPSTKSWTLTASVSLDGLRNYERKAHTIDKAWDYLVPVVAAFNKEVDARNKALMPAPAARSTQDIAQWIMSLERRNRFLQDGGLELRYIWQNVPEPLMAVFGNTYPYGPILKRFGFKWNATRKAWWIPYSEWPLIERRLMAALGPEVAKRGPAPSGGPGGPATLPAVTPWDDGPVWLQNTEHEDEAQDTGFLFTPLGHSQVAVKTTYAIDEYEGPPKRMSNEEGLKVWERLTEHAVYRTQRY